MPYIPPNKKLGTPGKVVGLDLSDIPGGQQASINNFIRKARANPTPAERSFHQHIAAKLLRRTNSRIRFVFQKEFFISSSPLITFIVDFYFPKMKVVVEIDGAQHNTEMGAARDWWRSNLLAEHYGIKTLHFTNGEAIDFPERAWLLLIDGMLSHPGGTPSYRKYLGALNHSGSLPFRWEPTTACIPKAHSFSAS